MYSETCMRFEIPWPLPRQAITTDADDGEPPPVITTDADDGEPPLVIDHDDGDIEMRDGAAPLPPAS